MRCGVCGALAQHWKMVDGHDYSYCRDCECIAINQEALSLVDSNNFPRNYDRSYWESEVSAAKERSWGSSVARVAETILYCAIPIRRFVDIGSGPGFLLDSLDYYLPSSSELFYGVEKFPPEIHSKHANYTIGDLKDVEGSFDAGVCIEVIEHLTPAMLEDLANSMAMRSVPGSLYLVNTGLSAYVQSEDPGYLDPLNRGHIIAWGIPALRSIFEPKGFTVTPFSGRTWAFCLEFQSTCAQSIQNRIWSPPAENRKILHDRFTGSVLYSLALDAARIYA